MKKLNINFKHVATLACFVALTSCQTDSEDLLLEEQVFTADTPEDNSEHVARGTCDTNEFKLIDATRGTDYNSKISSEIDDRSCSYNYTQSSFDTRFKWGSYRLNSANNTARKLQVRMERSSKSVKYSNGKFIQVKGTVRLLNVGSVTDNVSETSLRDKDGTYFAQVKGQHDKIIRPKESKDPAIVLFIAKPKRRNGGKGSIIRENGKVKEFNIFAEQVTKRGGSGSSGRRLVYITTVKRNRNFDVDIKTRFRTVNNRKRQYVDYTINGVSKTFAVPTRNTSNQFTAPREMRIRMGAYRCNGGRANILWRDNLRVVKN